MRRVAPRSSDADDSEGGNESEDGPTTARQPGPGPGPGPKPRRDEAWGRPARFGARLLAWPSLLLLGATFATAACLVAECSDAPSAGPADPIATLEGSDGASLRSLAFSADGSSLASLDESGGVEFRRPPNARRGLWPRAAASNPFLHTNANAHANANTSAAAAAVNPIASARAIALAPRDDLLAVSHRVNPTALYRLSDHPPYAARTFELDRDTTSAAVAFSPDGQTLAVGQADGRTTLWNVLDGTRIAMFDPNPDAARDSRFKIQDSGFKIQDPRLKIQDPGLKIQDPGLKIQDSRFKIQDSRLDIQDPGLKIQDPGLEIQDSGLKIQDPMSKNPRANLNGPRGVRSGLGARGKPWSAPCYSRAFVAALAFAPDGRSLAVAGGDRHVRVWGLADGRLVDDFSALAYVCVDLEFTPDGRTLAGSGPVAPIVHLWDVARHRERAALEGDGGPVRGLAISPDGRTLAAAGLEGRIDCWDLKTLRRRPVRLEHPGAHTIAFSPDGRTLATGGFDGTIKLWNWPRPRR